MTLFEEWPWLEPLLPPLLWIMGLILLLAGHPGRSHLASGWRRFRNHPEIFRILLFFGVGHWVWEWGRQWPERFPSPDWVDGALLLLPGPALPYPPLLETVETMGRFVVYPVATYPVSILLALLLLFNARGLLGGILRVFGGVSVWGRVAAALLLIPLALSAILVAARPWFVSFWPSLFFPAWLEFPAAIFHFGVALTMSAVFFAALRSPFPVERIGGLFPVLPPREVRPLRFWLLPGSLIGAFLLEAETFLGHPVWAWLGPALLAVACLVLAALPPALLAGSRPMEKVRCWLAVWSRGWTTTCWFFLLAAAWCGSLVAVQTVFDQSAGPLLLMLWELLKNIFWALSAGWFLCSWFMYCKSISTTGSMDRIPSDA